MFNFRYYINLMQSICMKKVIAKKQLKLGKCGSFKHLGFFYERNIKSSNFLKGKS